MRRTLTAAALVAAFTGMVMAQVKYVAVVETEVDAQSGASAKLNRAEVREVTTVLRNEARNNLPSGKYKIMTSETVIAQGGAVLEECAEENCVIALGSKIGADYIVRGSVSKFGTKLTLSIVMYETEDGTLVASARVSSEKAEDLLENASGACAKMFRTFVNEQGFAQKTAVPAAQAPTPNQQPVPASAASVPPKSNQPSYVDASVTLTDGRDGKKYKTVVIGGNRWMAENLDYQTTGGSWCYGNDNSNCNKYGRLYDWHTAKTACPAGWHLPSRQEWDGLVKASGGRKAGKKLKAKSGWNNKGNGADIFGFSALPGGYYDDGSFSSAGYYGSWWTVTEYSDGYAYRRGMFYDNVNVNERNLGEGYGFSVRCSAD